MFKFINKRSRTGIISGAVVGDVAVFLLFVILGKAEHEISVGQALFRTALPFSLAWLVISPRLGAYKESTLYGLRTMAWKIPLIWLLCGLVALFGRALLIDQPPILTFAVVSMVVQGALLIGWRVLFTISINRLFRS